LDSFQPLLSFWQRPLKFAKYLSEKQIAILQKDLEIYTIGDLIKHYPFRYEDRTIINEIRDLHLGSNFAQIKGEFHRFDIIGEGRTKRLVGQFTDKSGTIEVVWFQKIDSLQRVLKTRQTYLLYGKLTHFNGRTNFTHPEIEIFNSAEKRSGLEPIYSTTETLKRFGLDSKGIGKVIAWNLSAISKEFVEPFSQKITTRWNLMPLPLAFKEINFPSSVESLEEDM
jgi:ATP-dependent DNA helicase RecG